MEDVEQLLEDCVREALDKGATHEEVIDALRKKAHELAEELEAIG